MQMSIRTFRLLVIAPLVISFLSFTLGFLPIAELPESALKAKQEHSKAINNILVGLPVVIAILLLYFLAVLGLMVFWNVARYLYIAYFIVNLLWMLFTNPHVNSGLDYALNTLSTLTVGMVIALSFWSEVAELFKQPGRISA